MGLSSMAKARRSNVVITFVISALFLIVLVFLYFVWPTPYFYMKVQFGQAERIVEINRFTKTVKLIYPAPLNYEVPQWDLPIQAPMSTATQ